MIDVSALLIMLSAVLHGSAIVTLVITLIVAFAWSVGWAAEKAGISK